MNFQLKRIRETEDGIFGELYSEPGELFCMTLEHAYPEGDSWITKLPLGVYTCKKGLHRLHSGPEFETFEVMDVPGHSGILLHIGNFNRDSDGCILLGTRMLDKMIADSGKAFARFMDVQKNVNEFMLIVS